MTTEQEFFEAFKYEPEYRILMGRRKIDDIPVYEYFKNLADAEQFLLDEFEEGLGAKNIEEVYPPITPEIVLKLEEILLKNYGEFWLKSANGSRGYSVRLKGKEVACSGWWNSRNIALLKLCIQLKDEIQDQVRGIFNE